MTDAGAPPGPVEDFLSLVRDGQAKFASGEVEQARNAFAKALALKPDHPGAKAGLERCERLLAEREEPQPADTPGWPSDGPRSDDFPDSGENPEATIVDPNYLVDLRRGPDAGSSGEFPEPLTVPRSPIEDAATPSPEARGTPPQPGEPAYPRYVATMPGNYPEVRAGGRPAVASPPPVSPGTPVPAPPAVVAYPQMPPGGPSPYPQFVNPAGGYMPTPPPVAMAMPWQERRQMVIIASVGAGCLLLGLLLGWAMFGASSDDQPEAGSVAPLVARDAAPAAVSKATDAGATVAPAPGASATARVSVIGHPVLEAVTAPSTGQVAKLHARAGAHVKMGIKLYTLKAGKKGTAPEMVVTANRAGRFEVRAAEGDAVESGDVLALLVDADAWLLAVDTTGDAIAPTWRCEVASGDGANKSPCRIDSVEHLGAGRTRVTVRVAAREAGWLKGDEKDLTVTTTAP